jgi:hypothetical protein
VEEKAETAVVAVKPLIKSTTRRLITKEEEAKIAAEAKAKADAVAEAEAAAVDTEVKPRMLTYSQSIDRAMEMLDSNKYSFLNLEAESLDKRLSNYSPKMYEMLKRIMTSKGSNLVYSLFKTVEGLGVFNIVLKANGFQEIKFKTLSDSNPEFTEDTRQSFLTNPKQKRYISFMGGVTKERRNLILNIFNGFFDKLPQNMQTTLAQYKQNRNIYGEICWVIGITAAGAEGISLKCCRSVHIMEPYWNNVRLEQVKGRAIRICSHKDLPFKDRTVDIYTYCTKFTKAQLASDKVDMVFKTTDKSETSDEFVNNISNKKNKINSEILDIMKKSAVDCQLNNAENEVRCFIMESKNQNAYVFDPDLDSDIANNKIQFKEEVAQPQPQPQMLKQAQPLVKAQAQAQSSNSKNIQQLVSRTAPPPPNKIKLSMITYKDTRYVLIEKPKSNGSVFYLHPDNDLDTAVGEVNYDIIQQKYNGVKLYKSV